MQGEDFRAVAMRNYETIQKLELSIQELLAEIRRKDRQILREQNKTLKAWEHHRLREEMLYEE